MEKNWFKVDDVLYQEECPGDGWVAVEDYQQLALDLAWERVQPLLPLCAPISLEMLFYVEKKIRVAHD